QTARKSTGGRAPRKVLANPQNPANTQTPIQISSPNWNNGWAQAPSAGDCKLSVERVDSWQINLDGISQDN
ncbi:hypothetical protein FRC02_008096, partial [Tulasnella sp. 418]